jgi:catechol 2,3-dioxygenase-like lactoylglutathione lyase family enzyme
MARIRHIALLTKDTEKLAEFYKTSFGLNEVARSGEPTDNGSAIYLWRSCPRETAARGFIISACKWKT